jgi:hypothetical protein
MASRTAAALQATWTGVMFGHGNLEGFVPKQLEFGVWIPSRKICSKKLPKMPFLTESVMYWHPAISVFCDC